MYPTKAGLYLVQNDTKKFLVRFIGVFPCLDIKDGISIDSYFKTGKVTVMTEGFINLVKQQPEKWMVTPMLLSENAMDDDEYAYQNNAHSDFTIQEKRWLADTFRESKQAGCSAHSIITMIRAKFSLTLEAAIALYNEMERKYCMM